MHSFVTSSAILASTLFSAVHAFGPGKPSGGQSLAVYWGQGSNQNSLASFCADSTIDIIPIGFVNVFPDQNGTYGYPGTNFGNACGGGYYVDSKGDTTQLLASCPQLGADITYCQSRGKKVLLSLGGASTGVFVASDDSARAFGDFLHGAFGPTNASWTGPRPFGDACVDGFDFDIEATAGSIPTPLGAHYATMVTHLRTLGNMMITASPQCIVPDANLGDALANAYFDAIFVQFYNTPQCSARAFFDHTYGTYGGPATDISYDSWISWMQANATNPNALVYLGLPAAPGATFGEMYLTTTEAKQLLTYFQGKYPTQFGGAMLWEATFSENNQVNGESYAANIKGFLTGSTGTTTTSSTTTSSTTTSSTTTSSTTTSSTTTSSTTTSSTTTSSTTTSLTTTTPSTTASTTSSSTTSSSTTSSSTTSSSTTSSSTTSSSTTSSSTTSSSTTSSTTTWWTAGPSLTDSPVTTTDRYGNTFTYTPTDVQPTGASPTDSVVTTTDRNGNTFTYTPTQWSIASPTNSAVTTTDRNGNTFTYTPTNVQPTVASSSTTSDSAVSTTAWPDWDPTSSDASPVSTSTSSSTTWSDWNSSTTASPVSSSTSSVSWGEWEPTTTASSSTTSISSLGWTWHFSGSSTTSSISYETTITASDASTVTIMPLPATSTAPASIASWSSFWTLRGSFAQTASPPAGAASTQTWSTPAAPAAASNTAAAWSFPSSSTVAPDNTWAPLPSIATVTANAATSVGAVGASGWASGSTAPSAGVYVQPFTGAGSVSKPVFGLVAAVLGGALVLLM